MSDFDPDSVAFSAGHFIDGRLCRGEGERIVVSRPSDGRAYAELAVAGHETVDRAVRNADSVQRSSDWARQPPRARARVLRRWADLMAERREWLGQVEALGSTRPIARAVRDDVLVSAEAVRFFAEYADKLGGEVASVRDEHFGMIVSEPYGVIGAIVPWNFPISMAIWKVGPALAAGNSVVLKPSELTPFSAVALAELAVEAGIPAGIFNVVQGDGNTTGRLLCAHPLIRKFSFTGSSATGAAVMSAIAQAGSRPVTLELGGKSPQLVFADAPDMDRVADCIAGSILANAGQACVTGSRLIVEKPACDMLVDKLAERLRRVVPGATWLQDTDFSPIISQRQLARIDGIVQSSLAGGAQLLCGGRVLDHPAGGAFYEPTIIAQVDGESPAIREEIFGPVLTLQTFDDEEEGLALADHEDFGLAAGVYTSDLGRGLRAMRRIQAGTVWINRYGRTQDFVLPTGGYKNSGFGKDLGRQAVEACLRHKSVLMDISVPQ